MYLAPVVAHVKNGFTRVFAAEAPSKGLQSLGVPSIQVHVIPSMHSMPTKHFSLSAAFLQKALVTAASARLWMEAAWDRGVVGWGGISIVGKCCDG